MSLHAVQEIYKGLTFLIKTDNKNKLKNCKNLFFTFSNTPIKSFWTVLLPCVDPINRGTQPLQFVSDGNWGIFFFSRTYAKQTRVS